MSPLLKQLCLSILLLAIAAGGAGYMWANKPAPEQRQIVQKTLLIDVARAVPQALELPIKSHGVVKPRTDTALISEVSGQVVYVSPNFERGGFFKKNEIMLRLDDRNYRANVKRAEANVASARSALALEKGRAEVAYQDWLKFRSNVKRSQEAEDLALRKPQLADAQAKLDFSLAELDRARGDLARTVIRAPFHGLLREKQADLGQYVTTGSLLGRLSDIEVAEVRLAIADDRLEYLDLNALEDASSERPDVILTAKRGDRRLRWDAKLVRTEGSFDDDSRVLFVVARVQDPYARLGEQVATAEPLRFGSFVDATIVGREMDQVVAVPRHIIRGGNKLWVVDAAGKLQSRDVELLRTGGDIAYIVSGITSGERIALSAIPNAVNGNTVNVNQELASDAVATALLASRGLDGNSG